MSARCAQIHVSRYLWPRACNDLEIRDVNKRNNLITSKSSRLQKPAASLKMHNFYDIYKSRLVTKNRRFISRLLWMPWTCLVMNDTWMIHIFSDFLPRFAFCIHRELDVTPAWVLLCRPFSVIYMRSVLDDSRNGLLPALSALAITTKSICDDAYAGTVRCTLQEYIDEMSTLSWYIVSPISINFQIDANADKLKN